MEWDVFAAKERDGKLDKQDSELVDNFLEHGTLVCREQSVVGIEFSTTCTEVCWRVANRAELNKIMKTEVADTFKLTEDVLKLKGGGDWHMSYLNFYRVKK